jgi:ferric-dicitrate binding protein FerR (iron transport regulator)
MSFERYSPQEFAENELFRRWVLQPTQEISAFWEMFLSLHPEKQQEILEAKALVIAIRQLPVDEPDEALQGEMWQNIAARITTAAEDRKLSISRSVWKLYGGIAAAFVLLSTGGYWFLRNSAQEPKKKLTYDYLIKAQAEHLLEARNTAAADLRVFLPDSSSVVLTSGSRISYPANFNQKRTVFLDGDGFFDVRKNPSKPFVVYAGQLVTKVVGTSFWIRNRTQKDTIEVDVKTGCVAVAWASSVEEAFRDIKPQFLLVANQRAMYSPLENRLKRSLAINPVPVHAPTVFSETVYTDKPAAEIFDDLEKSYAVEIAYDADQLKNCRINTSFSDETFFQRLDIICRVLGAKYQIADTKIIVTGKSCE